MVEKLISTMELLKYIEMKLLELKFFDVHFVTLSLLHQTLGFGSI